MRGNLILMWLLGVGVISGSAEIKIETPEVHHFFLREGAVRIVVERLDLVIDVPLIPVNKSISDVCKVAKYSVKSGSDLEILKSPFKGVCTDLARRFEAVCDRTGVCLADEERIRRFLATLTGLIVTGLAGGAAGWTLFQGHTQSEIEKLAEQEGRLVHIVKKEAIRVGNNEAHIAQLAKLLEKEDRRSYFRLQEAIGGTGILALLMTTDQELAKLESLVDSILATGRVGLTTFTGSLREDLDRLANKLGKKGLQIPIAHHDIAQMPISFGVSIRHVLRTVIHVPVCRRGQMLDLFRHVPVPFQLENTTSYGLATDPRTQMLLGVEQGGNNQFYTLIPSWKLGESVQLGSTWLLRDQAVLPRGRPECLWGLFTADISMIKERCTVSRIPKDSGSKVWPLQQGRYLAFTPRRVQVSIRCQGKLIRKEWVQGPKVITLEPLCVIRFPDLEYHAVRDVAGIDDAVKITADQEILRQLKSVLSQQSRLSSAKESLSHLTTGKEKKRPSSSQTSMDNEMNTFMTSLQTTNLSQEVKEEIEEAEEDQKSILETAVPMWVPVLLVGVLLIGFALIWWMWKMRLGRMCSSRRRDKPRESTRSQRSWQRSSHSRQELALQVLQNLETGQARGRRHLRPRRRNLTRERSEERRSMTKWLSSSEELDHEQSQGHPLGTEMIPQVMSTPSHKELLSGRQKLDNLNPENESGSHGFKGKKPGKSESDVEEIRRSLEPSVNVTLNRR